MNGYSLTHIVSIASYNLIYQVYHSIYRVQITKVFSIEIATAIIALVSGFVGGLYFNKMEDAQ